MKSALATIVHKHGPRRADSTTSIIDKAKELAKKYADENVSYQMGGDYDAGGNKSDCSHYVNDVLEESGYKAPYVTTSQLASGHPDYEEVTSPQPGDIILQGGHMGIYSRTDADGNPWGYQMGNSGCKEGKWGPSGWFNTGQPTRYFRPKS